MFVIFIVQFKTNWGVGGSLLSQCQFQSLVREDPIYQGATKAVHHNY